MSAEAAVAAYPKNTSAPEPRSRPVGIVGVPDRQWALPSAVTLILGCSLLFGLVGADARWLAAMGHLVVAHGRVPRGVPFAAAPTVHWHNVMVLAEMILWALEAAFGDRGLVLAQALAVGVAFVVLARDALRAGATSQATASTCLLAALGAAPSLVIARVQLFSLALFPVLLALLRADARAPSARVWFVVPLLALWSNLHGAVLVGLAVTLVYLAVARLRERTIETMALAVLSVLALCANPAGVQAISYYWSALSNAAAQRGQGMWGPLSPTSPADVLLIVAAVALAVRAARTRPQLWEIVCLGLLGVMTVHASRSGIWLLLALVPPAAAGARPGSPWRRRLLLLATAAILSLAVGLLRGPAPSGADHRTLVQTLRLARGAPILAADVEAEQIALAGGRVWASDPIDAFQASVQVTYLEWMDGNPGGRAALAGSVRVVLVHRGTLEAALMDDAHGFRDIASGGGYELFERSPKR